MKIDKDLIHELEITVIRIVFLYIRNNIKINSDDITRRVLINYEIFEEDKSYLDVVEAVKKIIRREKNIYNKEIE